MSQPKHASKITSTLPNDFLFDVRFAEPGQGGIYALINVVTGLVYVGSTKDLMFRISNHFADLTQGKHFNSRLQQSFDTSGAEAFSYALLEVMPDADLIFLPGREIAVTEDTWLTEREQVWINRFARLYRTLNIRKIAIRKV